MSTLGLTTSYLTDLGQRLMPKTFSAVVSSDHIKDGFPSFCKSRALIINTLRARYQHGGHWVALFYDKATDKFHFFDPYGDDYKSNKDITKFLQKSKKKVKCHRQMIQSLLSTFCGFHALAFLIHLDRHLPSRVFFQLYVKQQKSSEGGGGGEELSDDALLLNDDITLEYIKSSIKQL